MAPRIHKITQHRSGVPGVEAMTLATNHDFPRHSHEQFGIGVIDFGRHQSWSGVGQVEATQGNVITVNPGEVHDGSPVGDEVRGWRMLYFEPMLVDEIA